MVLSNLIRQDLKLIGRDRFLLFMFGFVFFIAVVLRYLLPWLNGYLAIKGLLPNANYEHHLMAFYPVIISFFTLFEGALLAGTIFGFMVLDEKDESIIKAQLVTPIRFERLLLYRLALPSLLAFVCIVIQLQIIQLSLVPWPQLLLFSAAGALSAPICMLFLACLADNKVQGFAMIKFVSIAGWAIPIAWFFAEPLQWFFVLFPPFLVHKAYWLALEGQRTWPLLLAAGVIYQGLSIWGLATYFQDKVYKS